MSFSVIIPTLDEATLISDQIESVRLLDPGTEIIVADGGSSDGTAALARRKGVVVTESDPGRGVQCNAGARMASGDIRPRLLSFCPGGNNRYVVAENGGPK